jgi:hypothetical protein
MDRLPFLEIEVKGKIEHLSFSNFFQNINEKCPKSNKTPVKSYLCFNDQKELLIDFKIKNYYPLSLDNIMYCFYKSYKIDKTRMNFFVNYFNYRKEIKERENLYSFKTKKSRLYYTRNFERFILFEKQKLTYYEKTDYGNVQFFMDYEKDEEDETTMIGMNFVCSFDDGSSPILFMLEEGEDGDNMDFTIPKRKHKYKLIFANILFGKLRINYIPENDEEVFGDYYEIYRKNLKKEAIKTFSLGVL